MNKPIEPMLLELEEAPSRQAVSLPAVADNSPAALMLNALTRGASPEQIEKMMALQERWEANEARKAYNVAFAAFKAEAVRIIKNRAVTDGPLKGKSYAELFSVVDAVTPALSRHGLSHSWRVTKDDKDWIEVTCTLTHSQGHCESVSLGGPPDAGGAKNAIMARASTISYLQRYTLKSICGVAEGGEDDDGRAAGRTLLDTWVDLVNGTATLEDLNRVSRDGAQAFTKAKDVEGYRHFAAEVSRRKKEIAQ